MAAQLSGARDAEVMLATLDSLVERHPRKLKRGGVRRLRARLVEERDSERAETLGDPVRMALVIADLSACRLRVQTWQDPERRERELLEPGLKRVYGEGRRRYKRARGAKRQRAVAMHEWRKSVKDLRYLGEMLQRRPSPPGLARSLPGARRRARGIPTGPPSPCASSPAGPMGSAKCWARSTISRFWPRAYAARTGSTRSSPGWVRSRAGRC